MPVHQLTRDILRAALAGFEVEQQRIATQMAEVKALLEEAGETGASVSSQSKEQAKGKRGKRSAAVRERMAEAQQARWAKVRGETAQAAEPMKARRQMSEAGRKKIVAAVKKRWRLAKAQAAPAASPKAKKKPAPAKRAPRAPRPAPGTAPEPAA